VQLVGLVTKCYYVPDVRRPDDPPANYDLTTTLPVWRDRAPPPRSPPKFLMLSERKDGAPGDTQALTQVGDFAAVAEVA
jgi:hypothetical protein